MVLVANEIYWRLQKIVKLVRSSSTRVVSVRPHRNCGFQGMKKYAPNASFACCRVKARKDEFEEGATPNDRFLPSKLELNRGKIEQSDFGAVQNKYCTVYSVQCKLLCRVQ
eukprot:GFKZ01000634.1.p2 GENE.GFKZ01000634.1~~GFKZ01000634.1.p2  ORF type:complete len:111 (-),score=5.62 GFKZ01000634.1:78-410(-)